MALTLGVYVWPNGARPLAVAAVVGATAINLRGIQKTALVTRIVVALVMAVLAAVVVACLAGAERSTEPFPPPWTGGVYGVLQSAGLLFFAFAGYARIATLGEEVREPARTIPRAIPLALGITLAVYAAVGASVLLALGPERLAGADAPLEDAVDAAGAGWLEPVVGAGAAVAALGVLVSLLAGVSRTAFAMAAEGDLPRSLAGVHPRFHVPHRAELAVGAVVAVAVAFVDLRDAIAFSSFAVLGYYALTNTSALTLRSRPALPALGLAGCLLLAATLPVASVIAGGAVIAAGTAVFWVRKERARRR
jgi:APA family basic amino acid/polyamine antiporter